MFTYQAIARELASNGIESIFSLPGEDTIQLLVEAQDLGIDVYIARHENQAVAMADSYSRTTGKLGAVVLTGGPGFTNALTALNTAHRFGSPVLAIVGGDHPRAKYIPHPQVCASLGIFCLTPKSVADVTERTREAISEALGNKLVILNVPVRFIDQEVPETVTVAQQADWNSSQPVTPTPTSISNLADFLQESWAVSRPIILAGRGAILSDAGPALRELGDQIGALMACTLRAHGIFFEDSYDIGISGTYTHSVAADLMLSADCVLAFGASLNRFTTFDNGLFPKARVIQIDSDPDALGRNQDVDPELSLVGDARLTAESLVSELGIRHHKYTGLRSKDVKHRLREFDPASDFVDQSNASGIDPRTVAVMLNSNMPDDRIVVIDGGNNSAFPIPYMRIRRPSDFVQTSYVGGMSAIGLAMGASIGASVANPGRTVLAWMGDASHMMSITDIDTAVRYGLPIVVVVSNDCALGAEASFLELSGMSPAIAKIETPSLANVAESLGAEGWTVRNRRDLEDVASRLREPIGGPLVIDCYVNPAVRADWIEFIRS